MLPQGKFVVVIFFFQNVHAAKKKVCGPTHYDIILLEKYCTSRIRSSQMERATLGLPTNLPRPLQSKLLAIFLFLVLKIVISQRHFNLHGFCKQESVRFWRKVQTCLQAWGEVSAWRRTRTTKFLHPRLIVSLLFFSFFFFLLFFLLSRGKGKQSNRVANQRRKSCPQQRGRRNGLFLREVSCLCESISDFADYHFFFLSFSICLAPSIHFKPQFFFFFFFFFFF